MARYTNNPSIDSLPSGKIKGTNYQIRRHFGQAYLMRAPGPRNSFSQAEQEAQQRFAEATRLAALDMKNPLAKKYWNAHKGTYKRAYDAAKAHYLRLLSVKKTDEPLPRHSGQGKQLLNTCHRTGLFNIKYNVTPKTLLLQGIGFREVSCFPT